MRELIKEPSIQDLVGFYLSAKEIIAGWEIRQREILLLIRAKIIEQNVKHYEGINGELVVVTPDTVKIISKASRLRQNPKVKIRAPSVPGV